VVQYTVLVVCVVEESTITGHLHIAASLQSCTSFPFLTELVRVTRVYLQ
jgi:hypothetical protein